MAKRGPKSPLTDEHKAALALGRKEGRIVRTYLDALRHNKPKRGRKRTADSVRRRLDALEGEIANADALTELRLIQERRNLRSELDSMSGTADVSGLEREFIEVAKSFGERQGISYASWRDVGVAADVLQQAGITRGGG